MISVSPKTRVFLLTWTFFLKQNCQLIVMKYDEKMFFKYEFMVNWWIPMIFTLNHIFPQTPNFLDWLRWIVEGDEHVTCLLWFSLCEYFMNCPISYVSCEFLGIEVWISVKVNEVWSWFSFDLNYAMWNILMW